MRSYTSRDPTATLYDRTPFDRTDNFSAMQMLWLFFDIRCSGTAVFQCARNLRI